MFDSNVFDVLVDRTEVGSKVHSAVSEGRIEVISTHVQRDELSATPDPAKRARLLEIFADLVREVPAGSFVIGESRLDQARIDGPTVGTGEFDSVLRTSGSDRPDGTPNHTRDALIVDTAKAEGAILVSAEVNTSGAPGRILKRAHAVGVQTMTPDEFAASL